MSRNINDNLVYGIYIIAKNEEANISRALNSLRDTSINKYVLDSGSNDRTIDIAKEYNLDIIKYNYINHCNMYNEITEKVPSEKIVFIQDADMQIGNEVILEVERLFSNDEKLQVVQAKVQMFWDSKPLRYSSLYPPKSIAFRGGRKYFIPMGHGERLLSEIKVAKTKNSIIHDDRKDILYVLSNQLRYGRDMKMRSSRKETSWKDKIRIYTPFMIILTPIYCFIFKLGFMDGKSGLIYAIDRMIAEAIAFRTAISDIEERRLQSDEGNEGD